MKEIINNILFAFKNKMSFVRDKIFCISFQRVGTTSTGVFFKDHGYKVANWTVSNQNKWSNYWFKGDLESIFQSKDFYENQVFEDDPWWLTDFYKTLFYRFPTSKFILLERDADKWFDSMVSHSEGKTLGNTHLHSFLYDRLDEFYGIEGYQKKMYTLEIDRLLPLDESYRGHYIHIYKNRIQEIKSFFEIHDSSRLFYEQLEDDLIWKKMGDFFSIKVKDGYKSHTNASTKL